MAGVVALSIEEDEDENDEEGLPGREAKDDVLDDDFLARLLSLSSVEDRYDEYNEEEEESIPARDSSSLETEEGCR